jgi:acetylornithine/succinyldiaminopimelate/putrescine aminotransferase
MPDVRSGLDPKDYRYINPNPDPDFSPERNQAIINETIKETELFHNQWRQAMDEKGRELKDILSSYAVNTIGKGMSKSLKKFVGKKAYEALIGEKVLSKIRIAETINRLNGNSRFKKGILL